MQDILNEIEEPAMQNEQIAPVNPIIDAIPEGERVTVILRGGARFTGTDDTTKEEAAKGLFVLYSRDKTSGIHGAKQNKKTYLLASEVVGFEREYDA